MVGRTFDFIWRTQSLMDELSARHGPNFRMPLFGTPFFVAGSPDAAREILLDRDKNFSSERGLPPSISKLFTGGLMLRDFEEHRATRRIMQSAFRADALQRYSETMLPQIRERIAAWPRALPIYPAFKQLTLDLAARAFLGLPSGRDSVAINRAFTAAVQGARAIVHHEVPLLTFARGMRGRRALETFFADLIRKRRSQPGDDLLSELCRARSEAGERFSDGEISDHMIFLMLAAHDTTTSALAAMVHAFLMHPEWQERAHAELQVREGRALGWDERDTLPVLDRCFNEAIRLYPPAPLIARRSVRGCVIAGLEVPANTAIVVSPLVTHRLTGHWTDPHRFDPDRFLPSRAEQAAHSHLYYPFGGGAHVCIGMHLARYQAKAVLSELLTRYRLRAASARAARFRIVPVPHPKDGLPVVLEARSAP